jgi:hypothetical protein
MGGEVERMYFEMRLWLGDSTLESFSWTGCDFLVLTDFVVSSPAVKNMRCLCDIKKTNNLYPAIEGCSALPTRQEEGGAN